MAKETKKKLDKSNITEHQVMKKIETEVIKNTNNIGPYQPDTNEEDVNGICHLIECTCILPQYLNSKKPIFHKFIVFSELNGSSDVRHKFCQCNNCGTIHKIIDLCKSEILHGKEELSNVVTIKDLSFSLPSQLSEILREYKCEVYIWEYAKFIVDNKKWGSHMVLKSEELDGKKVGKFLVINGETKFGISTFEETLE